MNDHLDTMMLKALPDLDALPAPVAVVCHDAGATNLILGWVRSVGRALPMLAVVAEGPARMLWQAQSPSTPLTTLEAALDGAGCLLSGTGWASELEHSARMRARALGISVVAVVDHWVNYRQRFVRDGVECLPDVIWVGDAYALAIARAEFPGLQVQAYLNVYLADQVEAVRRSARPSGHPEGRHVLYALEPIRQAWAADDPRPGEFQALDHFLEKLPALGLDRNTEIRLRPHPSDTPGKYDKWIAAHRDHNLCLAPDEPIADAVAWSDWVVGCESFVLIIGVAAGRRVLSTLPPWGHLCRLPQTEILHIRSLEGSHR